MAQDLRAGNPGSGALSLSGSWRFYTGDDDPAWADPAAHDVDWKSLSPDSTWGEQG